MISGAKELLKLCRAGRLYEIQEWIANGRTISVAATFKKAPLEIAVESGFHSLVRLLAFHETSQAAKHAALARAVECR